MDATAFVAAIDALRAAGIGEVEVANLRHEDGEGFRHAWVQRTVPAVEADAVCAQLGSVAIRIRGSLTLVSLQDDRISICVSASTGEVQP